MPDIPYLIAVVAVLAAIAFAVWTARRSTDRVSELRSTTVETRSELARTRSELGQARSDLAGARSELDQLTARLRQAEERAETPRVPVTPPAGRHVEVFVNLSRRLQSLVHREIKLLDALENEVEDPDLLKGLFQVDHLATRIRRHAENLAVLGGSVSRRQWSRPVALTEVLRSAIAEVENYSRVKLVPPIDGTLPGHAVASVIHLIAELIENATMFAPPQTQVLLRAQQVTAGVAIEVEDRGLGMQRADQERVNLLLVNPEDINLDDLLRDGRIGLYVVSVIARQHGIVVQLQSNIYGGTQAVVILPHTLLGSAAQPSPPSHEARPQPSAPSHEARPQPSAPAHEARPQPSAPAHEARPQLSPPAHEIRPLASAAAHEIRALGSPPAHEIRSQPSVAAHEARELSNGRPPAREQERQLERAPGRPLSLMQDTAEIAHESIWPAIKPASGTPWPVAATEPAPPATPARPPLPRRRSQTHLAPQLQLGPPSPAQEPAGEHNPGLMASFMDGVSQGEADPVGPDRLG